MGQIGPQGLFAATALGHAALAAFTLMRIFRRTAPEMERKEPFITVPRTSPTFYALDPRSDGTDQ
jgi:hypothetical protein